jgi:hypothetical protein
MPPRLMSRNRVDRSVTRSTVPTAGGPVSIVSPTP